MRTRIPLLLLAVLACATSAYAQASASAGAAKALVQRLEARHMDAMAVTDPRAPDRFIAVLYVAPSQLLVVAARHPNPEALTRAIRDQRYRDVYLDLQSAPAVQDKLFVHDIGADGVTQAGTSVVDNAYENGVRTVLAKAGKPTAKLQAIDAEYARMLQALTASLDAAPAPSAAPAAVQTGLAR